MGGYLRVILHDPNFFCKRLEDSLKDIELAFDVGIRKGTGSTQSERGVPGGSEAGRGSLVHFGVVAQHRRCHFVA